MQIRVRPEGPPRKLRVAAQWLRAQLLLAPGAPGSPRWYETSLVVFPLSLAASIVLTVVAAMRHDLRWLLWIAWLLVGTACCAATSRLAKKVIRITVTVLVMVLAGVALHGMDVWLRPASPLPTPLAKGRGADHRVAISPPSGGWFSQWGATPLPDTLRSVVNVTTIMPYRSHFNVMLVYFVRDDAVDNQDNPRIMKSSLFSIHRSDPKLTIDTPINQKVLRETAGTKEGEFQLPMKVALLILPLSVEPQQISRLADAARLGGAVYCCNGFALDLTGKVVSGKRRVSAKRK